MRKTMLFAATLLTVAPALAAPPPPKPIIVTVSMADRKFHPRVIRLKGGQFYRLRFINPDRTEHDVYAPAFFGAARIAPSEIGALQKNRLNVPSHSSRSISLTPRAGRYDVKSTKALDVGSEMEGQILVD
jgi:plastocyanin